MNRLTEEQQAMASQYMPLAEGVARLKRDASDSEDDIKSECFLALCFAASNYRDGMASFYTFARTRIRGAAIDYIRQVGPIRRSGTRRRAEIPESQMARSDDAHGRTLDRAESREVSAGVLVESTDSFDYMLSFLDHRSQVILRSKYQDDQAYDVSAKQLGMTESNCSRIHTRAIEQLRERFLGNGVAIPA